MAMAGYRSEGAVAAGFHFNTSENSAVKVNAASTLKMELAFQPGWLWDGNASGPEAVRRYCYPWTLHHHSGSDSVYRIGSGCN